MFRRLIPTLVAIALAAASALALGATSPASGATAAGTTTSTRFAMAAYGYSTRVVGGQIPAGSDQTAFQVIGCTNKAGLSRRNTEATANFEPMIRVNAAATHVWTTSRNGVVSSWSQNKIASITLGDSTTPGTATINGITSRSRAYHNGTGFHARTTTAVLSVDPDGSGPMPPKSGPTPGDPVLVPGLAKISVGPSRKNVTASGASARADALRIEMIPSGTVAYVAHSHAKIDSGVVSGLFRGSSYASKATALDGGVTSGKTPYVVLPCQGTYGKVVRRDVARVNPSGLVINDLSAEQSAEQTRLRASAYERGRVARLRLGDASTGLLVRGIVGRANVHFVRGQGITKDVKGSGILAVTFDGETKSFGPDDTITIPGVVELERSIVKRTALTIQITALRVTLLGGPSKGAVVDLGVARVGFRRVGL